jgi:hypothetical protein
MTPKALLGEPALGHWTATHTTNVHGRYPIEGKLWVTSTRLVFVPLFRFVRPFRWSCALEAITTLAIKPVEASRMNRSPRPRVVVTVDGRSHFFLARDTDAVRAAVHDAMTRT